MNNCNQINSEIGNDFLLNKKLNGCKILIYHIIEIYNKLTEIIEEFQELIEKLGNNQFSLITNVINTKQIFLNSIETLFNNIVILFSRKIKNKNLINYSSGNKIINGYQIGYYNFNIERNVVIASINSYNIKISKFGVIKLIEYDHDFNPINVLFLGTHFNNINTEQELQVRLSKAFQNNKKTISYIKTMCMKYIQIYNNILKLI
jgi:hypothetical protein